MHKLVSIVCILIFPLAVLAQSGLFPDSRSYAGVGLIYEEEYTLDLHLHTNGLAIGYQKGKITKYYLTKTFNINFGYLRHPKEFRQNLRSQTVLQSLTAATGYTFGKQNNFFVIRAGMGGIRYFGEKAKRKGVAVGFHYNIGPSIGMLKPYYLDLKRFDETTISGIRISSEKYNEENAHLFLDPNNINGYSGFFKGFKEIKFVPGIQAKAGMYFSWGPEDQFVRVLETGLMLDLFTRRIPIMVIDNNQPLFLNLYVSLHFGKRK